VYRRVVHRKMNNVQKAQMDPRHLFIDERLTGRCVYCGGRPNTRDHCPSKVLLDEAFPANSAGRGSVW
jgi:hypothetical protein